jgi:DNA-directed RNA polymerase subunit RPC12/RpoP
VTPMQRDDEEARERREATQPEPQEEASPPPGEAEAYDTPPPTDQEREPAHAVPATSPGEATRCPRCGTENRPGLAFCSNCGQRLVAPGAGQTLPRPGTPEGTVACPRCGTHNRAGVAFCQNCGASLRPAEVAAGYGPPAAAVEPSTVAAPAAAARGGAVLGPVVLLIGAVGIVVGWLLPFRYGPANSLFERAFEAGGYGVAFWSGYPDVTGTLADQAYFGFAAPAPLLVALLVGLTAAGLIRGRPGRLQLIGLLVALLWAVGLVALFVVVEVLGTETGDVVGVLRDLSPAGIIFFLAGLIVLIGSLTRFART